MVVGVTVVSAGTSTPELAVGIDAALRGKGWAGVSPRGLVSLRRRTS